MPSPLNTLKKPCLCSKASALAVKPALWWLALVDFAIHTGIDRGKVLVGQRTRLPTTDARFWWLMGIDQFLHHVTHLGLAVVLAAA